MAAEKKHRKPLEEALPNEFFHVNRFRRWWVNLHVIASFWRLVSGFRSVSMSLKLSGLQTKLQEVAALRPTTIGREGKVSRCNGCCGRGNRRGSHMES